MKAALVFALVAGQAVAAPAPKNCADLAAPLVGKPYHVTRALLIMAGHRPVIPKARVTDNRHALKLLFDFAGVPAGELLAGIVAGSARMDDAFSLGYLETTGPSSQGSAGRDFAWSGAGFRYTVHATGCENLTDPELGLLCRVEGVICQ